MLNGFPDDFMYQLTQEEYDVLRSRFVISKKRCGGRRYLPYVFTQEGVAMLSNVLRSPQTIQVNIEFMRAFVRLKQLISTNKQIAQQITKLEKKYNEHDEKFELVFEAIRQILTPPEKKKHPIGFVPWTQGDDECVNKLSFGYH